MTVTGIKYIIEIPKAMKNGMNMTVTGINYIIKIPQVMKSGLNMIFMVM